MKTMSITQAVQKALAHDGRAKRDLLETVGACREEAQAAATVVRGLVDYSPANLIGMVLELVETATAVPDSWKEVELALFQAEALIEELFPDLSGACSLMLAHAADTRPRTTYPRAA